MGTRGVVTAGHYLAATAGFRIMEQGGNAIDATAAMCFCLNLIEPHNCGFAGEAPGLIYSAKEKQVFSLSGQGWSPQALTIDWCKANGIDAIPGDGYLPATVPATFGTWALALARFGTLTLSQVLAPTIELAENGFPMYPILRNHIQANAQKYREHYPSTAEIYLPNGHVPEVGDIWRNPATAATLKYLCDAEKNARGKGRGNKTRITGIEAAVRAYYEGDVAAQLIAFSRENPVMDASGKAHTGLLTAADFADWHAEVEVPTTVNYRGLDVYKCGPWTQGPVFLQQLALLQGFDLKQMGHNSAEYLHTLMECAKLAFADREAYYGDPDFDDVPLDTLLSAAYNDARRNLISQTANGEMRPGDVGRGVPDWATTFDVIADNRRGMGLSSDIAPTPMTPHDTTHCDAIDREGNMVACTPSGGWTSTSPVVPGLGFPLGTRAQIYYLNPNRPNALQPHKRPRSTLTPSLVMRDGRPYMVFGTQGDDKQDQWTLQFFLNMVDFGMNVQAAADAPLVHSVHWPSSFYPRTAVPNGVVAEDRIDPETLAALQQRGHEIQRVDGWTLGRCLGIVYDAERGLIMGGVSPRQQVPYAIGW